MTSAAHDESYGNPRWHHRPRGPWGFWGCGWQQASWNGRDGEGSWSAQSGGPAWGAGHPFWAPYFIPKPVLIVLTILGFMLWWPIGLVLLAITLCRRHMFCGHRWGGWQSAASAPGAGRKNWFGGDSRHRAVIALSTNTAKRPSIDWRKSRRNSPNFWSGCASPRTRPNSISS